MFMGYKPYWFDNIINIDMVEDVVILYLVI
ncbi:hypothetical protein rpr22_0704 [Rickettsia prowazekii str. Rp22]|uniref:Uncharacterized protein n=1 Tax=Rickettsia prowazekii (strain Rp22) TaxID=449216 RepID=D5AXS7_RICPP|nr:hypothetical protein rpr22_0704 [Rickettsia prowazekii str. Rp22]